MQELAWLITLILMLCIMGVFIYVLANSGERAEFAPVQKRFYAIRGRFFMVLLLVTIILTALTLQSLPYAAQRSGDSINKQQIDVTAYQWYWKVSRNEVFVDQPVLFNVKSADVNHGMGIYDESLSLLTQVQAMPGYENKLEYTFTRPGSYQILCLEYCGMAHHAMIAKLEVVTADQASAKE